jgi:hypothetical protein
LLTSVGRIRVPAPEDGRIHHRSGVGGMHGMQNPDLAGVGGDRDPEVAPPADQ